MSQSMKYNFHNKVDEGYISVTNTGLIKCMYVCMYTQGKLTNEKPT